MWRVTLKGVVAHRLRYALTALAVLLGVAFIAGSFVLTDTINSTFNGLYDQIYQGPRRWCGPRSRLTPVPASLASAS